MGYDLATLRMTADTSGVKKGQKDLKSFGKSAQSTEKLSQSAMKAVGKLAGAIGGLALINKSIDMTRQLDTALAEVSTLIAGTPEQMNKVKNAAIDMSNAYGGSATQNVKAFYQALSAGAESVEAAQDIVDVANKLAVGGMTDVETAVDGLTSAMNVYVNAGLTASGASDALFVAMKAGKTTIGEMSSALGRVAFSAEAAGVDFDTMAAAIAAITSGGINTNEAVTGLNAALKAITAPSEQAKQLAKDLGLAFNEEALAAQGLEKFLHNVMRATGGSLDMLNQLLGSSEAGKAVLALMANEGAKFSKVLSDMENKLGATDEAVAKVQASISNRLNVALAQLENALLGPGNMLLQVLVPALETAGKALLKLNRMSQENADLFKQISIGVGVVGAAVALYLSPVLVILGAISSAVVYLFANWSELSLKFPGMTSAVASSFDYLKNIFMGVWETVSYVVKAVVAAFNGEWSLAWEYAKMAALRAVQALLDAFQPLTDFFSGVIDNWIAMGKQVAQIVVDFTQPWIDGFSIMWETLQEMVAGWYKEAVEIGKNIIAGIIQGLKSMGSALAGVIGDLVRAAISQAKKLLGIASPSKVFAQIGTNLMLGFQVGVKRGRTYVLDELTDQLEELKTEYKNAVGDIAKDFKKGGSGLNLSESLFGDVNSPTFWDNFKTLAITSWREVMTASFSAGSPGMKAVADGMAKAIGDVINWNVIQELQYKMRENTVWRVALNAGPNWKVPINEESTFNGINIYNELNAFAESMKRTRVLLEAGIKGSIGGATNIKNYSIIEETKKSSIEGGKDIVRILEETSKSGQLSKIIGNTAADIRDITKLFSNVIGGASDRIKKVRHNFEISFGKDFKGIDPDNITKQIQAQMDAYANKVAKAALRGKNYLRKVGETWVEALERLAQDFAGVYNTLNFIGAQQLKRNLEGAEAASALAEAFGGVEEFNTAAMSYFNVAYSQDEQQKAMKKYIKGVMNSVGLDASKIPENAAEYKAMVEKFNLDTDTGRERYAAMVGMADMFGALFQDTGSDTTGADVTLDTSDVTSALSELISAASTAASEYTLASESLARAADSMRSFSDNNEESFNSLRSKFNILYNQSMAGNVEAMQELAAISGSYASAMETQATSKAQLDFWTATAANQLDAASAVAGQYADMSAYEQKSLEALYDAVVNGEITNKLVQNVVDAVGGLSNSTFNGLAALYKAQTGKTLTATNVANPVSIPDSSTSTGQYIDAAFTPTSTANSPAADTTATNNTQAAINSGIIEELKNMRKQIRNMTKREINIAKGNRKHNRITARTLNRWDEDGMPT